MSNEICLDPRLRYDYRIQVCEAAPTSPSPDASANASIVTILGPAPAATSVAATPLWRDSRSFRSALLRDAFPARAESRVSSLDNPLAYSLWALLPAACSEHPPLGENAGDGSGGSDAGGDGGGSVPPRLTGFTAYDDAPCGAQGIITDLDEGLGVCANYNDGNHHLFSWSPNAAHSARSIIPLSYPPDQVLQGSGNNIYITTHQNPGLSVVNPVEASESHFAFPTSLPTSKPSSSGRSLSSLTPSFPKGLVELAGQIFVAASNYDEVNQDFQPGLVLGYPIGGGNFVPLETSGYNPTSVGTANGRLLVVSSGALDRFGGVAGNSSGNGYLDVFDPTSYELIQSIPLGRHGAGLSGEMTISPNGRTVILPTADNSGTLLAVDLPLGQVREISLRSAGLSGDRVFLPSLQTSQDGRYVFVGNFNDGKVYTVELETGRLTGSPLLIDGNTGDGQGLSDGLRIGRDFFLGMGSRVLLLQTENP